MNSGFEIQDRRHRGSKKESSKKIGRYSRPELSTLEVLLLCESVLRYKIPCFKKSRKFHFALLKNPSVLSILASSRMFREIPSSFSISASILDVQGLFP